MIALLILSNALRIARFHYSQKGQSHVYKTILGTRCAETKNESLVPQGFLGAAL